MISGKKVVVVMPAYNAEKTIEQTVAEIDRSIVDEIIVVDDGSHDKTAQLASSLNLQLVQHERNLGYGGTQKTGYKAALNMNADIIILVHSDYQYTPKLIPVLASMLANDLHDVVLGSRMLDGRALQGGMPFYKYFANRVLTSVQNRVTGLKLSEYHTGYRAYSRRALETFSFEKNSNNFVFDNQFLIQSALAKFRIGETSCPTKYFDNASSMSFGRCIQYGMGCLWTSLAYLLSKLNIYHVAWLK
jgi:glycosyltransferase involved in cell wall biosynthesis